MLSSWITTLSLIFGGCCSNALTLEQLASSHPSSGTLITFVQFVLVTLYALPSQLTFTPYPRLKPRQIPLAPYLIQVSLFCLVSLLNNAAFAYSVPMSVHIIFRSGGLVVNMLLGSILLRRRYSLLQVSSVLLVTAGVLLTTLSASPAPHAAAPPSSYRTGIALLSLALLLSGLLGIVQDRTYAAHAAALAANPWAESMFYLHALALPMFLAVRHDLARQLALLAAGPRLSLSLSLPSPLSSFTTSTSVSLPAGYVPLALNGLTQLLCVAGVNQLTARLTSLSVTLVLAVRKAASLLISVLLFRAANTAVRLPWMWAGAALVMLGTVGYAAGSAKRKEHDKVKKE